MTICNNAVFFFFAYLWLTLMPERSFGIDVIDVQTNYPPRNTGTTDNIVANAFLGKDVLNSEHGIGLIEQGFVSQGKWEVYFHVVIYDLLKTKLKEVVTNVNKNLIMEKIEREKAIGSKFIDFFLTFKNKKSKTRASTICYALEFKVELKKEITKEGSEDKQIIRTYGGDEDKKTVKGAFDTDTKKLKDLQKELEGLKKLEGEEKCDEVVKWVAIIVESSKSSLEGLEEFLKGPGKDQCYWLTNGVDFTLALISVGQACEQKNPDLSKKRKDSEDSLVVPKNGVKGQLKPLLENVPENNPTSTSLEQTFVDNVLKAHSKKFAEAFNQGTRWEDYPQVLISTQIQDQIGYEKGIREISFKRNTKKSGEIDIKPQQADFRFEYKAKIFTIELKVALKNGKSLSDRVKEDLFKLQNVALSDKEELWVIGIANEAVKDDCSKFLKLFIPSSSFKGDLPPCTAETYKKILREITCPDSAIRDRPPRGTSNVNAKPNRKCKVYYNSQGDGWFMVLIKILLNGASSSFGNKSGGGFGSGPGSSSSSSSFGNNSGGFGSGPGSSSSDLKRPLEEDNQPTQKTRKVMNDK